MTDKMTPKAGARFGPYEIQGQLGRGGMGVVYRAWDGRLCREVAIKLLNGEFGPGGDSPAAGSRERFLQEARAASALNHPHICTVFDIGEKDGAPYLVMELMEGETLRARIGRGAMPIEEIVRYGQEIADALTAAHARGIVHRDIKPANIFLVDRPNGGRQTKVLDFGLAKVDGGAVGRFGAEELGGTSDGMTVGTVAYMSPEQARGEALDARSDLFSLGGVMYEMATRRPPFGAGANGLVYTQLLQHEPEPVRDWNDQVPRGLEKILLRLLEKEPEDRFQSAAELSAALAGLVAKGGGWMGRGPAAVPLVRALDPVARARRPVRRETDPPGADFEALGMRRVEDGTEPMRPISHGPGMFQTQGANGWDGGELIVPGFGRRKDDFIRAAAASSVVMRPLELVATAEFGEEAMPVPLERMTSGRVARKRRRRRWAGWVAAAAGVCVVVGVVAWRGRIFRGPAMGRGDRFVVAGFANETGDGALDGVVARAMELGLAESPYFSLGRAGVPVATAQAAAAKVSLSGVVRRIGKGYEVSVQVKDTDGNRELASVAETAAGQEQLLDAVDRVVVRLRAELGEGRESVARSAVPVGREGTASFAALRSYGAGLDAESAGRTDDAVAAYESAAKSDARFVQAQMRLAWLYRMRHEETASAKAARLAESAVEGRSERTALLARYAYELNALGNLEEAGTTARRFVGLYPWDTEGVRGLARVLRLQGRFSEALEVAERGIAENPQDGELYGQAAYSLIGLDRYDAALGMEQRAQKIGAAHWSIVLPAVFLAGREDKLAAVVERVTRPPRSVSGMMAYGLYLDNTGQIAAGTTLWAGGGMTWLLAQGALDRGLAGDCDAALGMARRAEGTAEGMTATFNVGMAAGLCGDKGLAERSIDELRRDWPQASAVVGYYLPDLRAAAALGRKEPRAALDALQEARPYDLISLTPYLRGLAHVEMKQTELGIVDFQAVLGHRGIALTGGSDVYPMAEIGLARAYAASGDRGNSVRAYTRFLELWRRGDAGNRLRVEAVRGAGR